MVNPNDMEVFGWDISSMNLGDALERFRVFDIDLQRQLKPHMESMVPRPSVPPGAIAGARRVLSTVTRAAACWSDPE